MEEQPEKKLDKEVAEKKEFQEEDIQVHDFDSFKEYFKKENNPLERMMATELFVRGYCFLAQHKILLPEDWIVDGRKSFRADFYLIEGNIIIETEGKIHLKNDNIEKDRNRHNVLTSLGYNIFYFSWQDVIDRKENWDIFCLVDDLIRNEKEDEEMLEQQIRKKVKK